MLLRYHHPFFGAPSLFPCLLTLDSFLINLAKYAIQDTWIGSDLSPNHTGVTLSQYLRNAERNARIVMKYESCLRGLTLKSRRIVEWLCGLGLAYHTQAIIVVARTRLVTFIAS